MSPELRFVAQLNRLARALDLAAARGRELEPTRTYGWSTLEMHADDLRDRAHVVLCRVAERGSRKSAG